MSKMNKAKSRRADQLRPVKITRRFTDTAAGSVLIEMGQTRVLCTASWDTSLPAWRKDSGLGWVTAEYSMLPGATSPRKRRSQNGHTDSRGTEIQRLIGRVLRAAVDFEKLGPNTIQLDCDVLQADGGTRTAAINGSYIALMDAVRHGLKNKFMTESPVVSAVAAISVGMVDGRARLDLDYELDSNADVDMNVAMNGRGDFIEIQGTGEGRPFSAAHLEKMLGLARRGIKQILSLQTEALRKRVTVFK